MVANINNMIVAALAIPMGNDRNSEMSVREMGVREMSVREMGVREMSVREMGVREMSGGQTAAIIQTLARVPKPPRNLLSAPATAGRKIKKEAAYTEEEGEMIPIKAATQESNHQTDRPAKRRLAEERVIRNRTPLARCRPASEQEAPFMSSPQAAQCRTLMCRTSPPTPIPCKQGEARPET